MVHKLNPLEIPHAERRSRGLNAEIDRLIWERLLKKTPVPVPPPVGRKPGGN